MSRRGISSRSDVLIVAHERSHREARTQSHLTQAELTEKMGTSQSTIARLESGKAKPTLATLRRLAKATGMRLKISLEPAPKPKKKRAA